MKSLTLHLSLALILILHLFSGCHCKEELVQNCETLDKRPGVCIGFDQKLHNCPPLLQLLRSKKFAELGQAYCSETKSLKPFWACCPKDELIESPPESFENHPNYNLLSHPHNSICGQAEKLIRIIGGKDAGTGAFPWMARLYIKRDEEDDEEEFACGGSIISKRYVLTAAHCFSKDKGIIPTKVRLGDTHDDEETECVTFSEDNTKICQKYEDYGIEDYIRHPGYADTGSQHDIALLRLDRDIQNISSLFVRPICLPFVEEYNLNPLQVIPYGTPTTGRFLAVVAGWGKLYNSDNTASPDLQYLDVPVTDFVHCAQAYKVDNVTITEHQICAGGVKGKGSCAGDSGGPLFYPTIPRGGGLLRNYQIGIVSFGKYQCANDVPVVYTRVRKYLSWILDNIKE